MEYSALKDHFLIAIRIVRENTIIFWFLCFLSLCNVLSSLIENMPIAGPLKAFSLIISLSATPIIYGIYAEIVEDKYSSLTAIIKTYIPGYIWLLVQMYLPALFIAAMPMVLLPETGGEGHFYVILISFSMLYLYVIPSYFITKSPRGAILSAIDFLFHHLSVSTPVLLTVLLVESALLILQRSKETLISIHMYLYIILDFSFYITASLIDFVIFIILLLLLKERT